MFSQGTPAIERFNDCMNVFDVCSAHCSVAIRCSTLSAATQGVAAGRTMNCGVPTMATDASSEVPVMVASTPAAVTSPLASVETSDWSGLRYEAAWNGRALPSYRLSTLV